MKEVDYFKRNLLSFAFAGFLFGVFLEHYFGFSKRLVQLLGLVALFLILYVIFLWQKYKEKPYHIILLIISLIFLGMGIFQYIDSSPKNVPELEKTIGQKLKIKGEVINFPEVKSKNQRIVLETKYGKILTYPRSFPVLSYGDQIRVLGVIAHPESFKTDSGKIFDYQNFLKKDGINYVLNYAEVEEILGNSGNPVRKILYRVKRESLIAVGRSFKEPQATLLSGILLGNKGNDVLEDTFRRTGLSHIVVLSGYNIAIVSSVAMYMLAFLPRRRRFFAAAIFVILFTLMVSTGASTVRAALMSLCAMFAKYIYHKTSVWRVLFLAVFAMIIWNPLIIFYDPGFQLSFLATSGIVAFSPYLKKKLKFVPEKLGLRETIAVSLSAQAAVLPLVIYLSGQLSTVSLPANLLVLPAVAPAMFLGFVSILVIMTLGGLALPFSFAASFFLVYIIKVAEFLGGFRFAVVALPPFGSIGIIAVYLTLVLLIFYKHTKKSQDRLGTLMRSVSMMKL